MKPFLVRTGNLSEPSAAHPPTSFEEESEKFVLNIPPGENIGERRCRRGVAFARPPSPIVERLRD